MQKSTQFFSFLIERNKSTHIVGNVKLIIIPCTDNILKIVGEMTADRYGYGPVWYQHLSIKVFSSNLSVMEF